MTKKKAIKRLKHLLATTRKYRPVVEKKLSHVPDTNAKDAIVESAAKYYLALKKLATK